MIRVITIFLLFFYGLSYGVNKAPVLLRACVNKQDSLITINWTSIQDGCGSFTRMDIYGDENDAVYLKVGSITDIAQKSIAIKVNDPTTVRNYFLSIHTLCDGLDSAQSNVIKIDNQAPSSTELDSVSYHFVTQNIIAGWSSNKTPDTERYRLTKPKGSGVDQEIAYTHDTFYTVSTDPHDVFYVKLSTVDSCDFHSPISTPHRVCYLQSAVDTCKKEIKLSWTP
jgi:hypothetical protein